MTYWFIYEWDKSAFAAVAALAVSSFRFHQFLHRDPVWLARIAAGQHQDFSLSNRQSISAEMHTRAQMARRERVRRREHAGMPGANRITACADPIAPESGRGRAGSRAARKQEALVEPADAKQHHAEPNEGETLVDAGEVVHVD